MHVIAYLACSIDGFIAGPHHEIEWLENFENPTGDYFSFYDLMKRIDCVLMGANTFKKVKTFDTWPYTKKVYVYSSSITRLEEEYAGKAELILGTPREIAATLATKGLQTICVDGGITVQGFLAAGLLDELYITFVSIILGKGIRLFGNPGTGANLRLEDARRIAPELLMCHYTTKKKNS